MQTSSVSRVRRLRLPRPQARQGECSAPRKSDLPTLSSTHCDDPRMQMWRWEEKPRDPSKGTSMAGSRPGEGTTWYCQLSDPKAGNLCFRGEGTQQSGLGTGHIICSMSLKEANSAHRVCGLRCQGGKWQAACLEAARWRSADTGRRGLLPRPTARGPLTWGRSGLLRPPWPGVCCVHSALFPARG